MAVLKHLIHAHCIVLLPLLLEPVLGHPVLLLLLYYLPKMLIEFVPVRFRISLAHTGRDNKVNDATVHKTKATKYALELSCGVNGLCMTFLT